MILTVQVAILQVLSAQSLAVGLAGKRDESDWHQG